MEESPLCNFRTQDDGGSPFINYGITLDGATPPDMLTANLPQHDNMDYKGAQHN